MRVDMYVFNPAGHAHSMPGVTLETMNVILEGAASRSDNVISVYDFVADDGTNMRVIAVMWRGLLFDLFEITR